MLDESMALQTRLLGALLLSPSQYLSLVPEATNGAELFDPRLRPVLRQIRDTDPNDLREEIIERLEADLSPEGDAVLDRLKELAGAQSVNVWLADLIEGGFRETPESIAGIAVALRERHRLARGRSALRFVLRAAIHGMKGVAADPGGFAEVLDALRTGVDQVRGIACPGSVERFVAAARTLDEMRADPLPVRAPVIEGGLLRAGQLGMIHGPDGARKSIAAIHGLVEATRGGSWFGLRFRDGGLRAGFVSLEDPEELVVERLEQIISDTGADPIVLGTKAVILTRSRFPDPVDVATSTGVEMFRRLVQEHRLDLVFIDHLSRIHSLEEKDLRPVVTPLVQLCADLQTCLLILHHDRKPGTSGKPGQDLAAARGDSRLKADCRLVIGMFEDRGKICFRVEKSTGGKKPDPVWLAHGDTCALRVTDGPAKPAERALANRLAMLSLIQEAGPDGAQPAILATKIGVTERTIRDYAGKLEKGGEIERHGEGRATRYVDMRTRKEGEASALFPGSSQLAESE